MSSLVRAALNIGPYKTMERQLTYFGGLLVRGSSKELLGWTTQDLQHAMRWADYWERVVHSIAATGDMATRTTLETAVERLRVKFPSLRLSLGDLGHVRNPSIPLFPLILSSPHHVHSSARLSEPRAFRTQARRILLRSLAHNLLLGRSMPAVAAVATAYVPPGIPDTAVAATDLNRGFTSRVSADAATTAVMRMVLVATQSQPQSSPHRRGKVSREEPKRPYSKGLRESEVRSAFESYCRRPSSVIKLASAR